MDELTTTEPSQNDTLSQNETNKDTPKTEPQPIPYLTPEQANDPDVIGRIPTAAFLNPKSDKFRDRIASIISKKHEDRTVQDRRYLNLALRRNGELKQNKGGNKVVTLTDSEIREECKTNISKKLIKRLRKDSEKGDNIAAKMLFEYGHGKAAQVEITGEENAIQINIVGLPKVIRIAEKRVEGVPVVVEGVENGV